MRILNILKNRLVSHSPLSLTHRVTSLCNARCKHCDLWKKSSEIKNDLSKEDIFEMLKKAKKAGMVKYTAWGGEPLLRKELPEILQYAKKNKFTTQIFTNGFFLKEKYKEIAPFTDSLIVSIDSNDELHDEMRGVKGILKRAIEGIELSKKTEMNIVINSVISNLNLDKIDGLLELSKKLGVSIRFEPIKINFYNQQFKLTNEKLKTVFSKIIEYKKSGYFVNNSNRYLKIISEKEQFICHAPKCFITVDACGDIISCLHGELGKVWGNIKKKSFKEIFDSREFKDFCKKMEGCNKCDFFCTIESSLAYSLDLPYLFERRVYYTKFLTL